MLRKMTRPASHSSFDNSPADKAVPLGAERPLRLSIAHLMLWTLGTAIALALFRPFLETLGPSDSATVNRYLAFQKIATLSLIPFGGASIAALIFAVAHRARGGKLFPVQPGHWLLILFGVSYLLTSLTRLVFTPRGESGGWELISYYWAYVIASAVLVFIQVLPLAFVRDAHRWTVYFAVELVRRCGSALVMFLFALSMGPTWFGLLSVANNLNQLLLLIGVIALAVTLVREMRDRPSRDYLHWTGCLTQSVWLLNNSVYVVYFCFLR